MNYKFKKILSILFLSILFLFFNSIEFPTTKAFFLDFGQFLSPVGDVNKSIATINIDTESNNLQRPFKYEQLKLILDSLKSEKVKNIVLMISPKEIAESENEKNQIFKLFLTYPNLYLFSPLTNGPLGGFYADPFFNKYPRHFAMPYNRDILIGAKDSKIRRIILEYSRIGKEQFIDQLSSMGFDVKPLEYFRDSFDLWDTRQIFQKTYSNGVFGQKNISSILKEKNNPSLESKTALIGTFDEFSVFISPSIFNFNGKLEKDNFKSYFYPINETAANIINVLTTGKYIKYFPKFNDLYLTYIILVALILLKVSSSKKLILLLGSIPFFIILYLVIFIVFDTFFDISKSVLILALLQYFYLPFIIFKNMHESEKKRLELVNDVRIDSFVSISEKIAHDIRSPLSTINLIVSTLDFKNSETKDILNNASKRIDEIAQNILQKNKNSFENSFLLIEKVKVFESINRIVEEKKLLASNITFSFESTTSSSYIMANRVEVERVLSNIFDNSIDALYDVNNPKISVSCITDSNNIVIKITDNGPGIPDNILSILGNFRVSLKSNNKKGSGIGLLHAKRIIQRMNGEFLIKSIPGETCVEITFRKSV